MPPPTKKFECHPAWRLHPRPHPRTLNPHPYLPGKISFEEFAGVTHKVRSLLTPPSAQQGVAPASASWVAEAELADAVRAKLRRAFVAFDSDGSGCISLAELEAAFRQSGIYVPDATLQRMFVEADADRSGAIELADFEALARRHGNCCSASCSPGVL